MSLKLPKRLSSKNKKPPKDTARTGVLNKLGLEAFGSTPLEPASLLDISTWTLESPAPQQLKDLPNAFLQRLWLLRSDARSPGCKPRGDGPDDGLKPEEVANGFGGESVCEINPLDLVTAVFMSSNAFLQQEMTVRMVRCQFAVPLVLPSVDPEEPSRFLLWPVRGVVSQWGARFAGKGTAQEGNLASAHMPMVSCVKLGRCDVSKSLVLNIVMGGLGSPSQTFVHRGMDGGQLPQRLSNGLVEIGWYLPTGDKARDLFPVAVVIANLRGDAGTHEKNLSLLCQASSAVVVFCGNLREKEKQLLTSCKDMASKLILVDLSDPEIHEGNENRVVGFVDQNLEEYMGLPTGSVLQGSTLSEKVLAGVLCDHLKNLIPDKLKSVTLETAALLAEELGLNVDEGAFCRKAMATVDEVLKGLDEGSAQFREKQLPLQGLFWSKLAKIGKEEMKRRRQGKEIDLQLQNEKKDILVVLSSYKMTPAMKIFTDALSTTDKVERTYFLSWMKLKLQLMQIQNRSHTTPQIKNNSGIPEDPDMPNNRAEDNLGDSDSFCTDSSFEGEEPEEQPPNTGQQVSEQQHEMSPDLEHAEKTIELQSQQTEHLGATQDALIERQLDMTANVTDTEIHHEDIIENIVCVEEQTSDIVSEAQSDLSESGADGASSCTGEEQGEPGLPIPESESTPSSQQKLAIDEAASGPPPCESDPFLLGLEHFLREMGLIFELTHIGPGSGSHSVLRLPSLATDLLLYGVPLELMDGDASNVPVHWLGCVFAELQRRLPQELYRTRVLTNLGVHNVGNAEVLTALFGVYFRRGSKISTKRVYMVALCLPDHLREDLGCDLLLLIDVEGLRSVSPDKKRNTLVHDSEMSTLATGLSDVLLQNISSNTGAEFETDFTVIVNALLRIKECGSLPVCHFLVQGEDINSVLQASQLRRVSEILQTERRGTSNDDEQYADNTDSITCIERPWQNMSLSEPIDPKYCKAVLKLKQSLFRAIKRCAAKSEETGLPGFMSRLCAIWDAVRADSFSIGLQNNDVALAFSLLCTELSQWKNRFLEHMESWLTGATKKIVATKAKALDPATQNNLLSDLMGEARAEVSTEVGQLRSRLEAYIKEDNVLNIDTFKPILMDDMDDLQERVTVDTLQKLEAAKESHCYSTQLDIFETILEKETESKLHELVETSKSTKVLLKDAELEEEFECVWSKVLSDFDFRPSETENITERVIGILKENLISRGLHKHMDKLEILGQNQTSGFYVSDEYFGYRSRLKHMFEDNNRLQRLEAQQVACNVIDEYNLFIAHKSSLPADFSDNDVTEVLQMVEKALKENPMEIRSAFEVDLKTYLCGAACQNFQTLHDRFAKDKELLTCITATKSNCSAEFIYMFRKRDQCQRVAQAFTSMIIKPTVLDYIYRPLEMRMVEEILAKAQQYCSPQAFHQSLLEDLMKEDCFESFLEYLLSYDSFRLKRIEETVVAHLSDSTNLNTWRQQRLGEIVGKIAAAVSQAAEGTNGVLSDTKPLLERALLILESHGDVDVSRGSLDGPLFSITTEWDRFVTCVMELLASMRLDLAQEFSQSADVAHILQCLSVQPQDSLFDRVRGCDKRCPLCSAPCGLEETEHEVHRALLHRPTDMLPLDSRSRSSGSPPVSMAEDNPGQSKDTQDKAFACRDLHSLFPDWSSPEDPTPNAYWRYVFARFQDRFAKQYEQQPAKVPEDWKFITEEKALDSLNEAMLTTRCY